MKLIKSKKIQKIQNSKKQKVRQQVLSRTGFLHREKIYDAQNFDALKIDTGFSRYPRGYVPEKISNC
jgi:hypothetical protein